MERYNDYYGMIPKGQAGFKVMSELWKLGEKIVGKISKTLGAAKTSSKGKAAAATKVERTLPKRALATAGTLAAATALDAAALDNASDQESNPSLFWPLVSTSMLVGSILYPNLYMKYGKNGILNGLVGMPATAKEWVEKNGGIKYIPSGRLNPFKLGFRLENPTNIMRSLYLQGKNYGRIGFYEKELANFNKAALSSNESQKAILDKVNKKIEDHNKEVKKLIEEYHTYDTIRKDVQKELEAYQAKREEFYDVLLELYKENNYKYPKTWTKEEIDLFENNRPADWSKDKYDMLDNLYPKGWTSLLMQTYGIGEIEPYSSIDEYADALNSALDHVMASSEERRLNLVFGENPATLSVSKHPTSADTRGALWRNFLRILDWVGPIVFGATSAASWYNYANSGSGSKESNKQSEDSDSTSIAVKAAKTATLPNDGTNAATNNNTDPYKVYYPLNKNKNANTSGK